jgi:hypothetical protein
MSSLAPPPPPARAPEPRAIEPSHQTAARLAGFLYLLTNAIAIFGFYARVRPVVRGNAVETARNIVASERFYRLGTASELVTVVGVLVLVAALYVVLRPIGPSVALVAVFLRLAENFVLAASTLNVYVALTLLSGADFLRAVDPPQLHALSYTFLRVHGAGFDIGFTFLGLGSAVFSYLWLRSRYIPRVLAGLGIFASLLLGLASLALLVVPGLRPVLGMAYMMPMGVFEIGLGIWLLVRPLRAPQPAAG